MAKKGRLIVRPATLADVDELIALDAKIYDDAGQAAEDSIRRRVTTFPSGVLIGRRNRTIAAALYLRPLPVPLDTARHFTWKEIENDGDFTPPSDIHSMYGVGLVGTGGTADVMMLAGVMTGLRLGVSKCYFGSRIPTLTKHFPKGDPGPSAVGAYVESDEDWEIKMYRAARILGITMSRGPEGNPVVLQQYFEDPESYNYGILWEWNNPFRGYPLSWLWWRLVAAAVFVASLFS